MNISERLSEFLSTNFVYDDVKKIWLESDAIVFGYNDGDEHENYLKDVLEKASDKSVYSKDLLSYIKDWPSQYHLTSKRSNLLRPFESAFNDKVILEIGCGCGAITRFLAESGAHVVSVEGSMRRAEIARKRCEGLDNVVIICAPSNKVTLNNFFDYVMLIGVLEYAKLFLGTDGHLKLLQSCKEQLKDNGSFFIAIENKLGLKYFAGEKEDHLGQPMIGINDSYQNDGICTYGRRELEILLRATGFNNLNEFLPFPDYKLPSLVVTPTGWKQYPELLSAVVSELSHKDPQLSADHTFSIEQATKSVWRNGMAADMSNSFLYVCTNSDLDNDDALLKDNIAAIYYSEPNSVSAQKTIEFGIEEGNLFTNHRGIKEPLQVKETFYRGESIWAQIVAVVNTKDWDLISLSRITRQWIDILVNHCQITEDYSSSTVLPSNMFDALPFNVVVTKNGPHLFDLEWNGPEELSLEYIAFRGLFQSFVRITTVEHTSKIDDFNICSVITKILASVFNDFDKDNIAKLVNKEALWMSHLTGRVDNEIADNYFAAQINVRSSIAELKHGFYSKVKENHQLGEFLQQSNDKYIELSNVVAAMNDDLLMKNNEINELSTQLNIKSHHLENIMSSRAWKITSKLSEAMSMLPFYKKK